jgi:DNA-binding MarR family transcriptional regulator
MRIALEPGLSVNELSERMAMPQQSTSRYVATLLGRYQTLAESVGGESAGRARLDPLIVQEISQVDPRRRALFLSEYGEAFIKKMLSTQDGEEEQS